MATPAYTGPLAVPNVPTRVPGTRFGGAKSSGLINADTQLTTTHTLVYAIKTLTGTVALRNGPISGPILWDTATGDLATFAEPLEFPNGLFVDVSAGTCYIQYKD